MFSQTRHSVPDDGFRSAAAPSSYAGRSVARGFQPAQPVAQLTKKEVEYFVGKKKINLSPVNFETVQEYVNNKSNLFRNEVLARWNNGQNKKKFRISTPADLILTYKPMSLDTDLLNYDSDEDTIDIKEELKKFSKQKLTTLNNDDEEVYQIPFGQAMKISRQAVKQNNFTIFPLMTKIGDQTGLFSAPRSNDVIYTPLKLKEKKNEKEENKYLRDGKVKPWTDLSKEIKDPEKFTKMLSGKESVTLNDCESEALGAIGCDFFKGFKGGRFYLNQSVENFKKEESDKSLLKKRNFAELYIPSKVGGRSMVSNKNMELMEEKKKKIKTDLSNKDDKKDDTSKD